VKGTILTGDFNAAVKEWIEENKLKYTEPSPFLFSFFFSFLYSLLLNFLGAVFFSLYLLC
jgi:hypothetical protein